MPLAPDAEAKLRDQLKEVFTKFDADGSGEVSTEEIDAMMQSLGMLVQPETLKAMMDEADTDKSGEIDFEEFFTVMKKQAEGSGGGPFAALVNRQKNAGPAMKWRADKVGSGVTIDAADVRKVRKEGDGWASVTLDGYIRDGKSEGTYDAADWLLEIINAPGPMYVGLASNNFDPSEGTEPNQSGGSAGNTIVVSGANGKVFNKKIDQAPSTVMKAFGAGETFQCELRMQKSSANFTILGADGSIKSGAALDVKIGVVTLMVGFGPVEAGKPPFEVILKGQSCEKTEDHGMDANETESNEKKAAGDAEKAAAMALA